MRANGPRIYTLAIRLCGGRIAEGEDLAQETFLQAYQHWSDFRGDAEVSTWLYRICVNRWKNRVRSEKRRSAWKHVSLSEPVSDEGTGIRELPSHEPAPDAGMEQNDQQARLQKAMAELEPEDRMLLVLREIEERPYEEMAQHLDWPLGTVKSRLARARDHLTQAYKIYE